MSAWPLVTVNVLAFNRRDQLAITLRTIAEELDYPADRLEVIVVDNASTDGTADMLRRDFPEVQVIVNAENTGVPAWNLGFAAGRGDFFLVLDDDCFITGDALKTAVREAQRQEADLVSFYVLSSSQTDDTSFSRFSNTGLLSFWGCSALMSRRAVERLGGYDPNIFLWAHELDFTIRLLDAGLKHVYLPQVRAVHQKEPGGFTIAMHRRNLRHFAYIAAKSLRGPDAAVTAFNLMLRIALESAQRPAILRLAPEVLAGLRDGLRHRSPVRAEVSRLYRRNFLEFVTPLRWARGPVARLRDRDLAPDEDLQNRREAFYAKRSGLYPAGAGALRV